MPHWMARAQTADAVGDPAKENGGYGKSSSACVRRGAALRVDRLRFYPPLTPQPT